MSTALPSHKERPHYLTLEPDAARETVLNLLRKRRRFALEQDPLLRDRSGASLKDVICIAIGGELIQQEETHDYATHLTATSLDDAAHFALGCLRGDLCFSVDPVRHTDGREEWCFVVERQRRGQRAARSSA